MRISAVVQQSHARIPASIESLYFIDLESYIITHIENA